MGDSENTFAATKLLKNVVKLVVELPPNTDFCFCDVKCPLRKMHTHEMDYYSIIIEGVGWD